MSEYNMNVILKEIEEFTPKTGFNLCSIDNHAPPGEQLALIAHFDSMLAAQEEQEKIGKDKTVIYGSKK